MREAAVSGLRLNDWKMVQDIGISRSLLQGNSCRNNILFSDFNNLKKIVVNSFQFLN